MRMDPLPVIMDSFNIRYINIATFDTYVEINSLNSVGLAGSSLAGDDANKQRNKLESEVNDGGHKTSVLFGGSTQLQAIILLNAIANIIGNGTKLSGKFISGISILWQTITLNKASTENQCCIHGGE